MKKFLFIWTLLLASAAIGNDYYTHGSYPTTGSAATSAGLRSELDTITAGFDKLPTITGNGSKVIAVNSGATALEAVTTTGTGSAVRATSPTLVTPALGTPSAIVLTNATGTAAGLTAGNVTTNANLSGAVTSSGSNATSLGSFTHAQLNAAVSDANLAASGDNTDISKLQGLTTTVTAFNDAGNITLTAAQILGGIINVKSNATGFYFDTATNILAVLPDAIVGTTIPLLIINRGNSTSTIVLSSTGADGITINDASSFAIPIASRLLVQLRVTATGTPAITVY